jgi:hypothetical protein
VTDTDPASLRLRRGLGSLATAVRTVLESRNNYQYRRLAEGYELPDGSRRIYCHHIRKTAGTSLHASFLELGGEDPLVVTERMEHSVMRRTISGPYGFVAHRPPVLAVGDYFYGWSHSPADRVALPSDTFTITVLRDPAARVVSLYRYLRSGDEPDMTFRVTDGERRMAAEGFDHFLDVLPPPQLLRQLFTFSRSLDVGEAADAIAACSSVFMCESFETGLAELAKRLDLPLQFRHDRPSQGTPPDLGTGAERLHELLEPEYQLLERLGLAGA